MEVYWARFVYGTGTARATASSRTGARRVAGLRSLPMRVREYYSCSHRSVEQLLPHYDGPSRLYYEAADPRVTGMSPLQAMLFSWFHGSMLPTLLCNFDRASMTHGIEVRMPFMDWRLVTYSFALPETSKIGGGYTKRVLRAGDARDIAGTDPTAHQEDRFRLTYGVLDSRRAKAVAAGSKRKPFLHRELGVERTRGKSGGRAGRRRKGEHRSRLAHTQCVCARASLQGTGKRGDTDQVAAKFYTSQSLIRSAGIL